MTTPPGRPLHIGMTADPVVPVPPVLYGGIERIIDFLVRDWSSGATA